jgi:hypothetical protein
VKSERKKANGPRGKPRGSGSGSGSGSGGKRGGRRPAAKGKRSKRDAKLDDDRHRFEIYRTIPQRHYVAMSGRQSKILHEQASRYGLPFAGRVINLEELLRAFHSFLAANARRLSSPDPTTDPLLLGGATPALERYRDERAQIASSGSGSWCHARRRAADSAWWPTCYGTRDRRLAGNSGPKHRPSLSRRSTRLTEKYGACSMWIKS